MKPVSNVVHGGNWRAWGYVSRLSDLRCGPSSAQQQAENTQTAVSQQQLQLSEQEQQLQSQQYQDYLTDIQPLKTQQTALASGDKSAALSAAMPIVSQVSGGFQASKQAILNQIPPGPARDAALANLQTQEATTVAGTEASLVQQAPQTLAAIGSGEAGLSLQQLGASLSGLTGAAASAGQVAQEENATQANKLGLIGGLAGSAGGVLGSAKFITGCDRRLKTNIRPLYPTLDKLLRLAVVKFDYKSGSKNQIGVIAQDLQAIIPEAVSAMDDADRTLYVDWQIVAAASLHGLQELAAEVRDLKRQVAEMRHEVAVG